MTKLILCTLVTFAFIVMSANGQGFVVGGLGESKPVDENVTQLVDRFKPDIFKQICEDKENKCPAANETIIVNSYKTQVVAGFNYFISATVGDEIYHIKIYEPLKEPQRLSGVQGPKHTTDELTYF